MKYTILKQLRACTIRYFSFFPFFCFHEIQTIFIFDTFSQNVLCANAKIAQYTVWFWLVVCIFSKVFRFHLNVTHITFVAGCYCCCPCLLFIVILLLLLLLFFPFFFRLSPSLSLCVVWYAWCVRVSDIPEGEK